MKLKKFWFIPTLILIVIFPLHYLSFEAKALKHTSTSLLHSSHHIHLSKKGYDFSAPNQVHTLEPILQEISGISYLSKQTTACVQDEIGMIFLLDNQTYKIQNTIHFASPNDYEGITKVNDSTLYVLQSEGNLYEVIHHNNSKKPKVNFYPLHLMTRDNEGLCYDAKNNRLLIGAKSIVPQFNELRFIYAFDLKTKQIDNKPIMRLELNDIKQNWQNILTNTQDSLLKKQTVDFKTSEIAVHPLTNDIYLLSALYHLLVILNEKGEFQELVYLNPDWFQQAEGMAFAPNGDLFISNEGGKSNATILKFKYKRES